MIREHSDALIDSILGCIAGGAIGDAAGAAFEGADIAATLNLDGADWRLTDDTQLTLATCEAIVEQGQPDPACIAASFVRWYRARRLTGLGASTLKALVDLEGGAHWALAGRKGEMSAGNGAAMRIAPLAFCLNPLENDARRMIRDVCRITHHNDEAYVGACAVVLAVWAAQRGGQSLEWIAAQLPDSLVRDRLLTYAQLPPEVSVAEAARRYGASGYVVESVPLALFAARRLGKSLGFAEMLREVIAAGGDTDTNASLAGQIAGTALGWSGLPKDLKTLIPKTEMVLEIAHSFADTVSGSKT